MMSTNTRTTDDERRHQLTNEHHTDSTTAPTTTTTTGGFPRAELEDMVQRWIQANQEAERRGDWSSSLAHQFYTHDAVYQWNMGPNQEFTATGRQEIADIALGYHMKGFEDWRYPYQQPIVIDERNGIVVCFWEQIGPGMRPDETPYRVDGTSGSYFVYAGNFQWSFQRDFFDLGNTKALLFEMAGANQLNGVIRQKISDQARGKLLPGTHRLRPEPSFCDKLQNVWAMIRIAFLG